MGVSQAFSSKLFTNLAIHALSIYTRYVRVSTHGKTHTRTVVFITARNALSTEYHFRGTSCHCDEPRFMLKCTRCAHTCHTNHRTTALTSPPYSLPTYLLYQRSALEKSRGWCSFDFSRGLSWKARATGQFSADSRSNSRARGTSKLVDGGARIELSWREWTIVSRSEAKCHAKSNTLQRLARWWLGTQR